MAKTKAQRPRGKPGPGVTAAGPAPATSPPSLAERAREGAQLRVSPDARRWIIAGVVVGLALTLYAVREVLAPFVLAAIVAYVLTPTFSWLSRHGVPRGLAVAAVYLAFLAVVAGGLGLLIPGLVRQAREFTFDADSIRRGLEEYARRLSEVSVSGFTIDVYGLYQRVQSEAGTIISFITARTTGFVLGFLSSMGWMVLILLISLYLLLGADRIRDYTVGLLPRTYRAEVVAMVQDIDRVLRAYVRGQLLLAAVIGGVTYIVATVLGLRYPLLLAVIAGIMEVVPVVGPILAAIPAILVALFQSPTPFGLANWAYALIVAGAYAVIQQLENNLLVPHIVGRSVDLHPVVILFGVVAGANLAGVIGVFLAVPVLATLRITARYLSRWMGGTEPAR